MIQSSANATNFSILCKGGEKSNSLFQLQNRPIGIGTDPDNCAIVYSGNSRGIEPFHCQLVLENGTWTLTDFSNSGTWLNGQKMVKFQHYPLKVGDVFYLASPENTYELRGENSSANADSSVNLRKNVPLSQTQHVQSDDNASNPNFNNAGNPNFNNAGNSNFNNASNSNFNNANNPNFNNANNPNFNNASNPNFNNAGNPNFNNANNPNFNNAGNSNFNNANNPNFNNAGNPNFNNAGNPNFNNAGNVNNSGFQVGMTQTNFPPQGQFQNRYPGTPAPQSRWEEIKEKFLTWEDRLNRKPYILRGLCLSFATFVLAFIVAFLLLIVGASEETANLFAYLLTFPLNVSGIMLGIRRLHDTNHSGWWLLVGLIPIVNFYVLYLLLFERGTPGPNRFGPDPLNQFP